MTYLVAQEPGTPSPLALAFGVAYHDVMPLIGMGLGSWASGIVHDAFGCSQWPSSGPWPSAGGP